MIIEDSKASSRAPSDAIQACQLKLGSVIARQDAKIPTLGWWESKELGVSMHTFVNERFTFFYHTDSIKIRTLTLLIWWFYPTLEKQFKDALSSSRFFNFENFVTGGKNCCNIHPEVSSKSCLEICEIYYRSAIESCEKRCDYWDC